MISGPERPTEVEGEGNDKMPKQAIFTNEQVIPKGGITDLSANCDTAVKQCVLY